jgi:hypothetical protein
VNIFALDNDPKQAACWLNNTHCIKMILESAQLLSADLHILGIVAPYKLTHKNHPCRLWVSASDANWLWLYEHAIELCAEYTARYGKTHKTEAVLRAIRALKTIDEIHTQTPFVQCMPDEYKRTDAVEAYRAYYIGDKAHLAEWKRNKPEWYP